MNPTLATIQLHRFHGESSESASRHRTLGSKLPIGIGSYVALAIVMTVCFQASAVDVTSPANAGDDAWTLPTWIANDQPIHGTFENGAELSPDAVRLWYRINDGEPIELEARVNGEGSSIAFTLPELAFNTFGFIHVWAESAESGETIGDARTIAIADWREFDISGQTDVELLFPMKAWGMQVRFTPCCLINAGYLRVERIPNNPAKNSDGLPETLASNFLLLAPDPTVIATAGLNADIGIDPESEVADSPEDITVYTWFKDRWTPVLGAELHAETNTIRFKAIEGGIFVLGPKPGV